MVMKAPVWGAALDDICTPETLLVVPTPAGRPFTQATAPPAPSTKNGASHKSQVFGCTGGFIRMKSP